MAPRPAALVAVVPPGSPAATALVAGSPPLARWRAAAAAAGLGFVAVSADPAQLAAVEAVGGIVTTAESADTGAAAAAAAAALAGSDLLLVPADAVPGPWLDLSSVVAAARLLGGGVACAPGAPPAEPYAPLAQGAAGGAVFVPAPLARSFSGPTATLALRAAIPTAACGAGRLLAGALLARGGWAGAPADAAGAAELVAALERAAATSPAGAAPPAKPDAGAADAAAAAAAAARAASPYATSSSSYGAAAATATAPPAAGRKGSLQPLAPRAKGAGLRF